MKPSCADVGQCEDPADQVDFDGMISSERSFLGIPEYDASDERLPQRVVGLSLSGGGIRSAAFSLGVLQALDAMGAFESVDYLSAVSGGGYTAAALASAMDRTGGAFPFATRAGPTNAGRPEDGADNDAVRGLRDRCRYLMPNGGYDLVVSLGIMARGLLVNMVFTSAFLTLFAAITLLLYPDVSSIRPPKDATVGYIQRLALSSDLPWASAFPFTTLCTVCLALWTVCWAVWRSFRVSSNALAGVMSDPTSRPARLTAFAMILIVASVVIEAQPLILGELLGQSDSAGPGWLSLPRLAAILTATTAIFALAWRSLLGSMKANKVNAFDRLRGVVGGGILYLLASALPILIYISYLGLVKDGLRDADGYPFAPTVFRTAARSGDFAIALIFGAMAAVGCLSIWSSNVGLAGETLFSVRWRRERTVSLAVPLVSIAATLGAAAAFGFICEGAIVERQSSSVMAWTYLAAAATLGLLAFIFTENANSLHHLYRDRLREAFDIHADGVPLTFARMAYPFSNGEVRRPFLIMNTTVNLHSSASNARRGNSDAFIFTPLHVGCERTRFVPAATFAKAEPHIDLATACAISGAAVSLAMGRSSVAVLAPTLALLNFRLGFWVRNPAQASPESVRERARLADWKLSYLTYEMFGLLNEKRSKVYLTDGGHYENLGLVQLLKRRCDVIVVSDATADPGMEFSDLINATRRARLDLGIRIDLPFQDIGDASTRRHAAMRSRPRPRPRSADDGHGAIGRVFYPARSDPPEDAKEGVVIYVKSSVTGDEHEYVLDYERRFPRFPHEPTSDQFFSEEQFEAYRALGFHNMDQTLNAPRECGMQRALLEKALRILFGGERPTPPKVGA